MARKLLALAAAAAALAAVDAQTFDKLMQTKTMKTSGDNVQVPPTGGSRPVGHFGVAQGTFLAGTQVTFKADASLSGGMFIKGTLLSSAKYAEFVGACVQPGDKAVSEYEWGYGSCDDWQTLAKAANLPSFTITQFDPKGEGSTMQASVALPSDSNGLYVIWENLLGMPLTFTNLQLTTVDGNGIAAAGVPVEFPAATVHMSAAVVYAGDHAIVDTATIAFTAKGTTPHGAKPTAVMALSTDDMAPERLGCTLGFYFGWFKSNVAGRDVCKGADFEVEIVGDVLTLTGTIKSIPPDMAGAELAGDIQVAPAAAFFQGDNHYTFSATPHGTEGFYVIVPNRLDTPITVQKMTVTAKYANLLGIFTSPRQALESGPVAGIVIAVLLATCTLVYLGYKIGKCRGTAAVGRQNHAAMV